jgi:hypothetical protein
VLGPLTSVELPQTVRDKVSELAQTHTSEEWLLRPGRRIREEARVKIAGGVEVAHRMRKAPGGLIRATVETRHGLITAVSLSGDFFFYPSEKLADLEQHLAGAKIAQVPDLLEEFYRSNGVESPGITPGDLAVVLGAEDIP